MTVKQSGNVTLTSLVRGALAAHAGNLEAAAEYILAQAMNNGGLLRTLLLPAIRDAIHAQAITSSLAAGDFQCLPRHDAPEWRPAEERTLSERGKVTGAKRCDGAQLAPAKSCARITTRPDER
jgi:hypothetical protein